MELQLHEPWNKASIQALLDENDRAVLRAVLVIFERQTAVEQASHSTQLHNNRGFTAVDAEFGSSLAVQIQRSGSLSPKQMLYARKMMKKYHRQLAEVANAKQQERVG